MKASTVVGLLALLVMAGCDDARAPGAAGETSPTGHASPIEEQSPDAYVGFRPPSREEEGHVVMPLVFVDGSTAEVVAPRDLGIQDMSAAIYTSAGLGGVDRTIDFRYLEGSTFMHEGPLRSYRGADGAEVELWRPIPDMPAGCPYLVFRFGDWFVGVRTCQNHLSQSEKEAWARSLRGRTDDGFLVLSAEAPLVLQEAGGHEGPELILGMDRFNWIQLEPGDCGSEDLPNESDIRTMPDGTRISFSRIKTGNIAYDWFATWCEDGVMTVQVEYASKRFVEGAAEGFRLREIVLAS